jgi:integrase
LTVRDTAKHLKVSESWVRRHERELPAVRLGRLVRLDPVLLNQKFSGKLATESGKPLEKEPMLPIQRRYQEGGVYKRGSIWYGTFRQDIMNAAGTIQRKRCNVRLGEFPTKSAARKELQKHLPLSSKPSVEMTLSELFQKWEAAVVPTLKHSTASVYIHALRSRILPTLGGISIAKLGYHEIASFLAAKAKQYAQNTLKELRSSLSQVLSYAVKCEWLEKNPCLDSNGRGIPLPQGTGRKITRNVLTPEQTKAIANKLEEPYSTLFRFMAVTGLRIGEAVGIQWSDFDGSVLNVQRRIYEGVEDTVKTRKSKRSLPIPPKLLKRLKALPHTSKWVFSSSAGTPVNPGNALKRYIHPVARELGIALSGYHDTRHTVVTDTINSGVDPKTVSQMVGHANVGITLDMYTHPALDSFKKPLNRMAARVM